MYCLYLQQGLDFFKLNVDALIKCSVETFLQSSKSELSVHAQLLITLLYILLENILAWYHLVTYIKDTPL